LFFPLFSAAQQFSPDRLRLALQNSPNDSVSYRLNMQLNYYFQELNRDSALFYIDQAILLAAKNNNKFGEANAWAFKGYQYSLKGKYSESLQSFLEAFSIIEETKSEKNSWCFTLGTAISPDKIRLYSLSRIQNMYSVLMSNTQNTEQEIFYLKESLNNARIINDSLRVAFAFMNLGFAYVKINKLDSALIFENEALSLMKHSGSAKYVTNILTSIGYIYQQMGNRPEARRYYNSSLQYAMDQSNLGNLSTSYFRLCNYYLVEKNKDSSLYYAAKTLEAMHSAGTTSSDFYISDVYENLFLSYQLRNQFDSAFKYQGMTLVTKDSIYKDRIKNLAEFQSLGFSEQLRLRDLEKEKLVYQSKIRIYSMLAGIAIFMLIAYLLYINNRNSKKANKLLQRQKDEIEIQKKNVEQTLLELKSTQSQLIQSEKMASLGELTAGIAHEIQNPLNFVNNFSDVNTELIDEMEQAMDRGNLGDAKAIAKDIKVNEYKINHHGKRADSIVKSMLQHSQSSIGVKEPTNINALADEYLRLSYHGFMAKDKSLSASQEGFTAIMKTDYDDTIGNINIIPRDIGRVLLNLYNNAFYTVREKKKQFPAGYEPEVSVRSKRIGEIIEISVKDNGMGIPGRVKDKIFQPFFTTKPTGQGTGLGLSLSYDIVKAHGGELKMETKEGEGSEFVIHLPEQD